MVQKILVSSVLLVASFSMADTQIFTADKMTCGSCVERVETKVCKPMLTAKKLTKCEVTVGSVTAEADKVPVEELKKAITKAGYPVTAVTAGTTTPAATEAPAKN